MASYKLSGLAQQDIEGITEYTVLNFGERQAVVYNNQLHKMADMVANFPSMGLPYTTKKGRVYQKFSVGEHALFFRPTEYGIFIARILHLRMDFDRHLSG